MTFQFSGTQISYVYSMASNLGYANIYIDGSLVQSNLDAYLAGSSNYLAQKLWTYGGLAAGNHTIKVQATGTKNPASSDQYIVVDAFIVGTSYNDNASAVSYTGTWKVAKRQRRACGMEMSITLEQHKQQRDVQFYGVTFVTYVSRAFHQHGNRQHNDRRNEDYGTLDEYCPTNTFQGSRTFSGLSAGSHTFTITVSGSKNSASSATYT